MKRRLLPSNKGKFKTDKASNNKPIRKSVVKRSKAISNPDNDIANNEEHVINLEDESSSLSSGHGGYSCVTYPDPEVVLDLDFHPTESQVMAVALISGTVQILHLFTQGMRPVSLQDCTNAQYIQTDHVVLCEMKYHTQSCTCIRFLSDGIHVVTASSDLCIAISNYSSQQIILRMTSAHSVPISALCICGPYLVASGDDDGGVKLWDTRDSNKIKGSSPPCLRSCGSFKEASDFISGFCYDATRKVLLACSGDGSLSVFSTTVVKVKNDTNKTNKKKHKINGKNDLCYGRMLAVSDNMDEELLSVQIVKHGTKVICGTQDGVLLFFSWNEWADYTDRFRGHPQSVGKIIPMSEKMIVTGSSDGLLRVCSIFPNKLLGVIGGHDDLPIESLSVNFDKALLASAAHAGIVKIWDIQFLGDPEYSEGLVCGGSDDSDSDDSSSDNSSDENVPVKKGKKINKRRPTKSDSSESVDESSDSSDGASDDDMKEVKATPPSVSAPTKKRRPDGGLKPPSGVDRSHFFADL